jgi:excisionase family DNA binding protein
MEKQFLKINNAAELIDVSPWTIRKWIEKKILKCYRFGGAIRIKETDLLAFAAVSTEKPKFFK